MQTFARDGAARHDGRLQDSRGRFQCETLRAAGPRGRARGWARGRRGTLDAHDAEEVAIPGAARDHVDDRVLAGERRLGAVRVEDVHRRGRRRAHVEVVVADDLAAGPRDWVMKGARSQSIG